MPLLWFMRRRRSLEIKRNSNISADVTCWIFGSSFRTFLWNYAKIQSTHFQGPGQPPRDWWSIFRSFRKLTIDNMLLSDEEHISSCKEMEFFKRKSLNLACAKVLGFISHLMLNFWTFPFWSGSFIRCEQSSFCCQILPPSRRFQSPIYEGKWFLFDLKRPLWAKGHWDGMLAAISLAHCWVNQS